MARTYEPIASTTLGTATNTVTFSLLPQTFTDLYFVARFGTTGGANTWLRFNSDSNTVYSATMLRSTGSSISSPRRTNENAWLQDFQRDSSVTADICQAHLMNYSSTSSFKTGLGLIQSTQWDSVKTAGLWRSTDAITSITYFTTGSNFTVGSVFSVYGIKAA